MDSIDAKILKLLQEDGRMPVLELSKQLNLSRPSINERLRKLQETQAIKRFSAIVSPEAVGKEIMVIILVSDVKVSCKEFEKAVKNEPDIIECHRISGANSYTMKAVLSSVNMVEQLVDRLIPYARLNTSLVLSSPVSEKEITPKICEEEN